MHRSRLFSGMGVSPMHPENMGETPMPLKKLLCLVLLVFSSAASAQPSALDRVQQRGELVIGTDASYPPFESAEGGKFEGFDIDIGRAVARELGVEARFVNSAFDGIFPALQNGQFDAVMSAVSITPERQQSMLFSAPYYTAGQLVVVQTSRGDIAGPDDLPGKRVGVQINTTGQFEMEKRGDVKEITRYNTIDLALLDLQNGRIDAVVGDAPTVRYMIRQRFPGLRPVGRPFTEEHYGIAMAQGSEPLRDAVNAALKTIRASGEYDRIHESYFGAAAEAAAEEEAAARSRRAFDPGLIRRTFPLFLAGLWLTFRLAVLSFVLGLPLGLALALGRVQPSRLLRAPAVAYVEVMRGTPLLVQILFIYFVLPTFGVRVPAFWSGLVALTLNSGAYIAEILRAGILSIDPGQSEAARSLGMTYWQSMRRIILPQTFQRVVPPLTNEMIALLKDSSLVSVIGLTELARTGQELASRYAAPLTIWPMVAAFYLLLTIPLTQIAKYLELKWRPVTRT
jgi:His/Glu/Gln/Arg/opine family amino acid ABC transporter permease subunit